MNEPKSDVNIEVVGTGCAYSCGFGCLVVLVALGVGAMAGATISRIAGPLAFFAFLAGLASHVGVGYFTARAAREKGVALNLHIFVVGGLIMLIGVFGLVMRRPNTVIPAQTQALQQLLGIVSWLSVIPLMLLGASFYASDESQNLPPTP